MRTMGQQVSRQKAEAKLHETEEIITWPQSLLK
jgi:hypothetical protein